MSSSRTRNLNLISNSLYLLCSSGMFIPGSCVMALYLLLTGYLLTFKRSSRPEVFLGKGVPKICSKFIGEHPCQSAISIKLQNNFIEIERRHGCSPGNLLEIFRTTFLKNTSGRLLLV